MMMSWEFDPATENAPEGENGGGRIGKRYERKTKARKSNFGK